MDERKDETLRFYFLLVHALVVLLLVACGDVSQEKVMKKLDKAWTAADGYEIEATMEMKLGAQSKTYNIEVWHVEPEYYRVKVSDEKDTSQLILRNDEGVFVVSPSTNKSYKFQSDWPHKNSQAYLLEGLLAQIKEDDKAKMTEEDKSFVFIVNLEDDKSGLPVARIEIDKKTLKPKAVHLLDENEKEQVAITFNKTKYSSKRAKEDFALEKYAENEESEGQSDTPKESKTTYYPTIDWGTAKLIDEQTIKQNGVERTVLSYSGEKSFTIVQQPIQSSDELLPVFAPGDPIQVGASIGSMTENSLTWQQGGKEFFLASSDLDISEMLEVAGSLVEGSLK